MPNVVYIVDDDVSFHAAVPYLPNSSYFGQATITDLAVFWSMRHPGIGGIELMARLLEVGSTLPVVFVSAYEDIEMVVRVMKAGADDFLIKSVAFDELLATIERAIVRHDVSRKLASMRACVARLTPRERRVST